MPDLKNLADALVRVGFSEFAASFNPLRLRQLSWYQTRARAPEHLKPFVDLFLLNEEIAAGALPGDLHWIPDVLASHGLATLSQDKQLHLNGGLVLLPLLGRWLFCAPPGAGTKFYLGDDSVSLMMRAAPKPGGAALDLCAGTGLQALHCAGFCKSVTAVELDENSANLARINAALNTLQDRIDVRHGNLYEPVRGKRFDTVIANPPLLPFPDGLPDLPIGHGGPDGMQIAGQIVEGLPAALGRQGRAQIISSCLTDAGFQHIREWAMGLARSNSLDIHVNVLSAQEMAEDSAYLNAISHAVSTETGTPLDDVKDAYVTLLKQQNADTLAFLFLLATHGTGVSNVMDMTAQGSRSVWHIDVS